MATLSVGVTDADCTSLYIKTLVCVCVCARPRARSIGELFGALVPVFYVLCVLLFPDRDVTFNVDRSRKKGNTV